MNLCSCGSLFNDQFTHCPRCEALQIFGLGAHATETEIRNAYRLFVKAWSPDSLQGDQPLKEAAEAKLKDINTAFEFLTATSTERAERQRPIYLTSRAASPETTPDAAPAPRRASPGYTTLVVVPNTTPPPPPGRWQRTKSLYRLWRRFRMVFGIVALVFALITGRSIRTYFKAQRANSEQATSGNDSGKQSGPKKGLLDTVWQELQSLDQRNPAPAAVPQAAEAAPAAVPQTRQKAPHKVAVPQPSPTQTTIKVYPYLTVGSSKDDVLDQLGTPAASSEDKLVYGKSELYLKNGVVIGWRIDPVSSPIRVKLWPESPVDTSLDYFTYGSSKDVVLVVQGTPTAFSKDKFEYGGSEVDFRNNRVVSWKNDPGSIPLRTGIN